MASKQYISIIRLFQHCDISIDDNFNLSRVKKQLQAEFGIASEGFVEVDGYSYTRHDVFEEIERTDFLLRLHFHKRIWESPYILGLLENNSTDLVEIEKDLKPFNDDPEFDIFFSPYFAGPFNYISRTLLSAFNLEELGNLFRYEAFLQPEEREEAFRPIRLFLEENFVLLRNVNAENYKLMRPKMLPWIESDWHGFFNNLPHEFYDIKGDIALKLVNIGVAIQKKHRRDCRAMSQQLVSLQDIPEHLRKTITSNHLIYNSSRGWTPNLKGGAWVGWIIFMFLKGCLSNGCNDTSSNYDLDRSSNKVEFQRNDNYFKHFTDSLKTIDSMKLKPKPLIQ